MGPSLNRFTWRHKICRLTHVRRSLSIAVLLLLTAALLGGCDLRLNDTSTLEGLVLPGGVILVTEAGDYGGLQHDLIYIHGIEEELTTGAMMQFVISGGIAESYPYQAQGVSAKLLSATSSVIQVPIDHAPRIKMHLGEGAYLVDVRDPAEYAEGHLVDSVNSPWSQLEGTEMKPQWDFGTPLFIYGRDQEEAAAASQWFKEAGYSMVIDLGSITDFTFELE